MTLAVGDRALMLNELSEPLVRGRWDGPLVKVGEELRWCTVVAVNPPTPQGWPDEGLRVEVTGGCGGGTWLPSVALVLASYTPTGERDREYERRTRLVVKRGRAKAGDWPPPSGPPNPDIPPPPGH